MSIRKRQAVGEISGRGRRKGEGTGVKENWSTLYICIKKPTNYCLYKERERWDVKGIYSRGDLVQNILHASGIISMKPLLLPVFSNKKYIQTFNENYF